MCSRLLWRLKLFHWEFSCFSGKVSYAWVWPFFFNTQYPFLVLYNKCLAMLVHRELPPWLCLLVFCVFLIYLRICISLTWECFFYYPAEEMVYVINLGFFSFYACNFQVYSFMLSHSSAYLSHLCFKNLSYSLNEWFNYSSFSFWWHSIFYLTHSTVKTYSAFSN